MSSILFEPWVITPTHAVITWTVQPNAGVPVRTVRYRAWRATSTPGTVTTSDLSGSATIAVDNFDGTVTAEVTVVDAQGSEVTRVTQFYVRNRTQPSAPDWLVVSASTPSSLTLQWGAAYVSTTTAAWHIYHREGNGNELRLATVPVNQYTATLSLSTSALTTVFIRGVDQNENESSPSPSLSFTSADTGPSIVVAPWHVSLVRATTQVTVDDPTASVSWTLARGEEIVATGSAAGEVTHAVPNFQGKLRLTVVATAPNLTVRRVVSDVSVWNVIPRAPEITVQHISATVIRVLVTAAPNDPATTPYAELTGLGLPVRQALPLVYTYSGLSPETTYTFTARGVNPAGYLGAFSAPLAVRTYAQLVVEPELPGPLTTGPVMRQLAVWLQGDLRDYFLQFTADTRILAPLAPQATSRPVTLYPFLDAVEPVAKNLGSIIRAEVPDQESFDASLVIDKAGDTIQKIAIWCERLQYGKVTNKAV